MHLFNPDLAEALGWTLLHSLWQGLLIFVITVPVLVFLKKHAPSVRYPILCLALLLLTTMMAATFYLHLPESYTASQLPDTILPSPEVSNSISPVVADSPETVTTPISTHSLRRSANDFIHQYAEWLVNGWLIGVLLFAMRWLAGLLYTYRLKRQGVIAADKTWQKQVDHWSKKIGITRGVRLLESVKTEVPVILGHLKPVILLPVGTLSGLSPQQIEVIILHELAHIRRHDFVINLLVSALEIVLFYHPVYWWLADQIQQEREKSCDDIAVAVCGNARLYARTLLLMEEKRQQNSLAMAYQGKKHHLLERIKRICMATPVSYRPEYGKAGLSLAFLMLLVAVSWAKMPETPIPDAVPNVTEHESVDDPTETHTTPIAAPESSAKSTAKPVTDAQTEVAVSNLSTPPKTVSLRTAADTIPYVPDIPAMRNAPKLPTPPDFPYTLEKLNSELAAKSDDHTFLRKTIDQYRASLEDWQSKVKQQYMAPWQERKDQLQDVYETWKDQIHKLAKGDQVAESVALKGGILYFERAVKEHENAVKNAENQIKDELENYIKEFENAVKAHENKQADHDERMAIHDDRMHIHDLRMSVHDSRMTIHDQRLSIHDVRMSFHDDRMAAHDVLMAAFEKEFFSALEADGLGKRSDKVLEFIATTRQVIANGKILEAALAQKYMALLKKYGFQVKEGSSFIYEVNEHSRRIGTSNGFSTFSREDE